MATLYKQLTIHHGQVGEDFREYLKTFRTNCLTWTKISIETVVSFSSVLRTWQLQELTSYTMETRVEIPNPDVLKGKIVSESIARKSKIKVHKRQW